MNKSFSETDMRTAIRQAGACSGRWERDAPADHRLANDLYEALIDLEPRARARRIRVLDDVFGLMYRRRNR